MEGILQLRAEGLEQMRQLHKLPNYDVGVMRVVKLPRPVPLGIVSTTMQVTKILCPVLPTRGAPRGTVRPASRRRSPKHSTSVSIPKGRMIRPARLIDYQDGLELLACLRKAHLRLLGRRVSRRRFKSFIRNRTRLHDHYPNLWPRWLRLEAAQRESILGVNDVQP